VHISGLGSWHSVSIEMSVDASTVVLSQPAIVKQMKKSTKLMRCNLAEKYIAV
jgi:hypothetical protein